MNTGKTKGISKTISTLTAQRLCREKRVWMNPVVEEDRLIPCKKAKDAM
jgi:hypothetical protein